MAKYADFISRSETGKVYTSKVMYTDIEGIVKGMYYIGSVSPHALSNGDAISIYSLYKNADGKDAYKYVTSVSVECDADGDLTNIAFGKVVITEGDKKTYFMPLEVFKALSLPFDSLTEARKFEWPDFFGKVKE